MQIISICIEALILALGFMIAVSKKKVYGWGFVVTFGIYVIYDLAKDSYIAIPPALLSALFFIATISMLWTVWLLYKRGE